MKLLQGDCLELMREIQDGSVDMICCDLPYGTTACAWDSVIPFSPLWEQYERIAKHNAAIVLFGSEPFSSYLRISNIKNYRYDWIWHKNTSASFANANKMPMKYHENISVFYRKLPTYNPQFQPYSKSTMEKFKSGDYVAKSKNKTNKIQAGLNLGISPLNFERGKYPESVQFFKAPNISNGQRLHPTQKPVALLEYLIKTYTNPGETVLDNCMGSGSTGVACANTGRDFIGIELDPGYFKTAQKRIEDARAQMRLEAVM